MNSKFKTQYYHKIPQTNSPYLQLLEAKKKILGYKFEIIKNERSQTQHSKSPNLLMSQQYHPKNQKTFSNEKQKSKSVKPYSKKKRSNTQHADDRLHESLFLNHDEATKIKKSNHQATKSLFNMDGQTDPFNHSFQFMRYNLSTTQDQKNNKKQSPKAQNNIEEKKQERHQTNSLQKLEITQIDDLINLIESCIEESNDYISYLTQKIQNLNHELIMIKEQNIKIIKIKDGIIFEKERQIDKIKNQIYYNQTKQDKEKTFQIKKLLEIIQKLSEQNNQLKNKMEGNKKNQKKFSHDFEYKEKNDIYNEIHNKIDILNISIDKKNSQNSNLIHEPDFIKQGKKVKYYKQKNYK